jgi:hypothetical protein
LSNRRSGGGDEDAGFIDTASRLPKMHLIGTSWRNVDHSADQLQLQLGIADLGQVLPRVGQEAVFHAAFRLGVEALNQVGWGFKGEPKEHPVFRLGDRQDVLGDLTVSADQTPTNQSFAVRATLDWARVNVVLGALANTFMKLMLVLFLGHRGLFRQVLPAFVAIALAGIVSLLVG